MKPLMASRYGFGFNGLSGFSHSTHRSFGYKPTIRIISNKFNKNLPNLLLFSFLGVNCLCP